MNRIIYWALLLLSIPGMLYAQDNIETPIWNVGDKWVFDNSSPYLKIQGTIEVVRTDQNTYTAKFVDDICVYESQGFNTILFKKSNLHRSHIINENKREVYKKGRRTIFNFPLYTGKQWKDSYSSVSLVKGVENIALDYFEIYKVSVRTYHFTQ